MEIKKILIIDGIEASCKYPGMMLRNDGFSLELAVPGKVGLIKAEVENTLGFQVWEIMPNMDVNFSVSNNRTETALLKFPIDAATLVMEHTPRQLVEL